MVSDVSSSDFESYKKWYDHQNSFTSKALRGLKPVHLILFVVLIAIGYMLWNQEGTNKNVVMIVIGGIVVLIIIMNLRSTGKIEPIPENVAWQISQRELDRKVANGQVPTGTQFIPTTVSKLIYWSTGISEGIPFRWKLLYKQRTPDNLEKSMIQSLHPFFGYSTGFFPGTESDVNASDIKIIYPEMYVSKPAEEEKKE